jgi:methenyltetrahydrofolate cyclohydrolase
MLADLPLRELLNQLASPSPTPGAGGAAAAAAALGTALIQMVAALPKTKTGAAAERTALNTAAAALAPIREELARAIDADAVAYNAVIAAYKLPRATDSDRDARTRAVQNAMRGATDSPLGIVRLAAAGLKQAAIVGANGHAAAAGEVGVGMTLLQAALKAARVCVQINLNELQDESYKAAVASELRRLAS